MESTTSTITNRCADENSHDGCTKLGVNTNTPPDIPSKQIEHIEVAFTEDNGNTPFEWLTNFASLRHLILPSRIVFGPLSSTLPFVQKETSVTSTCNEEPLTPPQTDDSASSDNECQNRHQNRQPQCIKLNALHVGCGTSTVGESLLYLTENVSVCKGDSASNCISQQEFVMPQYKLQYGHVVNVDIDNTALDTMKNRWKLLDMKHNGMCGKMDWRYVDFQNEESCRVALDPLYRTISSSCSQGLVGGYFDLVFDKSTLDCLLCSESDAVAGLLCEVYRALRIPCLNPTECTDDINLDHLSWGGIYVLITFHPLEFIRQLLIRLPGAEWMVEHEVVRREVEDVGASVAIENCDHKNNEEVMTRFDLSSHCIMSTGIRNYQMQQTDGIGQDVTKTAWSSGTFEPDENYRKTVNVFTCRRLSRQETSASSTPILDRDEVRQHVEQCCNEWYKTTNPMVTDEREREIAISFSRATGGNNVTRSLDLKQCYAVLFTELEREHLPFEYFLDDWEAYCSGQGNIKVRDRMTLEVALDFLREMQ
ncbi:hypothetical protein HJC23_002294 [Cyclotella cryptica]|uniref:Uncharacterized protein n=1 Tax=Cyclotella cryptica TaxID=29204 RepID=A0ABD3QI41_9STRA|eukprot:CCRYP_005772-RA/>CCRYP_005772-RA protein AED:0.00 eAED:0.00 QI:88/-1/1/1/-1/1/1/48/536